MPKSSEFSRRRFLGDFAGAISCASHFLAGRSLADTFSSGVSQQEDNSTVFYNEKKRLVYHKTASPCKPYVKELYTAGGVQVLRDSPHDHKHHHGLMFAVRVDGVDFWSETPGCGREEPQGIVSSRGGGVNGNAHHILDQCVAWRNATGEVLLDETRAIGIAIRQENPITLVTWRSQLRPPKGKAAVKL
nr:PmoA family protein [Pirellulaceae bacterium]